MDKLPEKVIQLDAIRIDYGRKKSCRCLDPKFTLDVANRLVTCDGCGSICDPFDVLRTIAMRGSRWNQQAGELLAQNKALRNYQPRRKVIKALEQQYVRNEKNKLVPTCPCCKEPFRLELLASVSWVHERFLEGD